MCFLKNIWCCQMFSISSYLSVCIIINCMTSFVILFLQLPSILFHSGNGVVHCGYYTAITPVFRKNWLLTWYNINSKAKIGLLGWLNTCLARKHKLISGFYGSKGKLTAGSLPLISEQWHHYVNIPRRHPHTPVKN